MKGILSISGLAVLCCGAGMGATVAVDLNGDAAQGATVSTTECHDHDFVTADPANITAARIHTWLNGTTGWQGNPGNGNTGITVWGRVEALNDTDVSVTFINRNAYKGALVGTAVTLAGDLASYTGLTLSVNLEGLNSGAGATTLNLVYQTADGWQLEQLSGMASTLTGTTQTVSVDLTDKTLTSDTAYIVMSTRTSGGTNNENLAFSMSATTQDVVPEPATASLSLLGLSLLMLRRKR